MPLIVRRVVGSSMQPYADNGDVVVACRFLPATTGSVHIIQHGNKEIVKRVQLVSNKGYYVVGDNALRSTDSRHFGWLQRTAMVARVLFVFRVGKRG